MSVWVEALVLSSLGLALVNVGFTVALEIRRKRDKRRAARRLVIEVERLAADVGRSSASSEGLM